LPGLLIPITNDYTYYTGVEEYAGNYPSGVPYSTQNATVGLEYNSPLNDVTSGIINIGDSSTEVILTSTNNQIVPGLFYTFTSPSVSSFIGYIAGINVDNNPNKIALQLIGTFSGTGGSLAGGNLNIETESGNESLGALYANTIEGTEIKRFYTDTNFTQKWIPPVADKFYVFRTTKNYDPNGTGKYTDYPYFCARFDGEGEIVEQVAPGANSQTAWFGQNPANSGLLPITNYSYNVYYETP